LKDQSISFFYFVINIEDYLIPIENGRKSSCEEKFITETKNC